MVKKIMVVFWMAFSLARMVSAGPYTEGGIAGYIGSDHRPISPIDPGAVVNPIFEGWAAGYVNYLPADSGSEFHWDFPGEPNVPARALGPAKRLYNPVIGWYDDTVSLGELSQTEILQHKSPGEITLTFAAPIQNGPGYDLAVFENGFLSANTTPGGSIEGQMFCELAYVEVSSDGVHFARFPSVSLTPGPPTPFNTIDIANIYNLAGKHPNSGTKCYGTPFDLSDLSDHPLVFSGVVNLNNINYVKIVDIPGCGDSLAPAAAGWADNAVKFIDPTTWPDWDYYTADHPIFDAWQTYKTGGVDLDAVGVLHPQLLSADVNLDGRVDLADLIAFQYAWLCHFGDANFVQRCDLADPKDHQIDVLDLAVFCDQWLGVESWAGE
jgi:hypothetical protein